MKKINERQMDATVKQNDFNLFFETKENPAFKQAPMVKKKNMQTP